MSCFVLGVFDLLTNHLGFYILFFFPLYAFLLHVLWFTFWVLVPLLLMYQLEDEDIFDIFPIIFFFFWRSSLVDQKKSRSTGRFDKLLSFRSTYSTAFPMNLPILVSPLCMYYTHKFWSSDSPFKVVDAHTVEQQLHRDSTILLMEK